MIANTVASQPNLMPVSSMVCRQRSRSPTNMVHPSRTGRTGLLVGHSDDVDHGLFAEVEPGAGKREIRAKSPLQADDLLEECAGLLDGGGLDVDVVEACNFDGVRLWHRLWLLAW